MKKIIDKIVSPDGQSIQIVYDDGTFETKGQDSEELQEIYRKEEKKKQIEQIATLTDQLNLIAGVLSEFVLAKPEDERSDLEKYALEVFFNIKDILNK